MICKSKNIRVGDRYRLLVEALVQDVRVGDTFRIYDMVDRMYGCAYACHERSGRRLYCNMSGFIRIDPNDPVV